MVAKMIVETLITDTGKESFVMPLKIKLYIRLITVAVIPVAKPLIPTWKAEFPDNHNS